MRLLSSAIAASASNLLLSPSVSFHGIFDPLPVFFSLACFHAIEEGLSRSRGSKAAGPPSCEVSPRGTISGLKVGAAVAVLDAPDLGLVPLFLEGLSSFGTGLRLRV